MRTQNLTIYLLKEHANQAAYNIKPRLASRDTPR